MFIYHLMHVVSGIAGDHSVEVRVAGMLVPGSPFLVKAYDATKVRVTEVATGIVAKPVYFSSKSPCHLYTIHYAS